MACGLRHGRPTMTSARSFRLSASLVALLLLWPAAHAETSRRRPRTSRAPVPWPTPLSLRAARLAAPIEGTGLRLDLQPSGRVKAVRRPGSVDLAALETLRYSRVKRKDGSYLRHTR